MENSGLNPRVRRTRANRNGGVGMDTLESAASSSTNGVSMAPTAQLMDKRKSQELEMYKQKVELQKERIDELIKERDYLKEQLASALKKRIQDTQAISLSSSSSCDSSEEDSSELSTSSSTASSSEDKKKKRRKKKGKERKSRKSKKMEPETRKRVTNPDQAVSRYKKILRLFNRGRTMSAAFKRVGVDRNTVVATAPIAELFIAAPSKYKELLKSHNSQVKLKEFATQCATSVQEEPGIADTVKTFKVSGKLLPLKKK